MKSIIFGLLLAASATSAGATLLPWQEKGVELAKAETKVIDAMWGQDISFWVSVKDDGTDRSGYANYICMVLSDAGKPQGEFIAVTIWDVAGMGTDNSKQLAKTYCQ